MLKKSSIGTNQTYYSAKNHLFALFILLHAFGLFTISSALNADVLSQTQAIFDGVGDVSGLAWARASTTSPDGKHLYLLGGPEGTLVVFNRASETGNLTFQKTYLNGNGVTGVHWLDGARTLVLTPSGDFLILACNQGIQLFQRDPSSGRVNSVQRIQNGWWDASGISGLQDVVVSPDGKHTIQ